MSEDQNIEIRNCKADLISWIRRRDAAVLRGDYRSVETFDKICGQVCQRLERLRAANKRGHLVVVK